MFPSLFASFLTAFRAACRKVDLAGDTVDANANTLNRFKAKEEHIVLTPAEVKKRRRRHQLQARVEICFFLDLLWLSSVTHSAGDASPAAASAFPWSSRFCGHADASAGTSAAAKSASPAPASWRKAAAAAAASAAATVAATAASDVGSGQRAPFSVQRAGANDECGSRVAFELLRVMETNHVRFSSARSQSD